MNTAAWSPLTVLSLLLSSVALAAPLEDEADAGDERVVRSAEGPTRERSADELRDPRTLLEARTPAADVEKKPRAAPADRKAIAAVQFGDSYIYDASTDFFADRDGDGYYHYLRVRFDVDSIYNLTYVYAKIFISADGNAWEHLYTTADFSVAGTDPDDDYEVETELVGGYSTGLYDVLIELYDADDNVLVDEFGPDESSDFSLLPLEDSTRDGIDPGPPPGGGGHHGGGGAVGWVFLPALALAAFVRRRRELRVH